MSMDPQEAVIHRVRLERMLLLALQRHQQETGEKIDSVVVELFDEPTPAGQEQHVLTKVRVVVRPVVAQP